MPSGLQVWTAELPSQAFAPGVQLVPPPPPELVAAPLLAVAPPAPLALDVGPPPPAELFASKGFSVVPQPTARSAGSQARREESCIRAGSRAAWPSVNDRSRAREGALARPGR